jgi:hypothetical protein
VADVEQIDGVEERRQYRSAGGGEHQPRQRRLEDDGDDDTADRQDRSHPGPEVGYERFLETEMDLLRQAERDTRK